MKFEELKKRLEPYLGPPAPRKPYLNTLCFIKDKSLVCKVVVENVRPGGGVCDLHVEESSNPDYVGLKMNWVDSRKFKIWGVETEVLHRIANGTRFTMQASRFKHNSYIETSNWSNLGGWP